MPAGPRADPAVALRIHQQALLRLAGLPEAGGDEDADSGVVGHSTSREAQRPGDSEIVGAAHSQQLQEFADILRTGMTSHPLVE
ncbi:hypothetical protein ACWEO2_29970 [Nocardia sp. NPDC004278]